jgi:hypothetical protein
MVGVHGSVEQIAIHTTIVILIELRRLLGTSQHGCMITKPE